MPLITEKPSSTQPNGTTQSLRSRSSTTPSRETTSMQTSAIAEPVRGPAEVKAVPAWRFACLSFGLGIGLFMSFMDGSITSTAIYSIGAEFGSMTKITWIALAYTLADVGLAIVFTSVANILGRFNTYLVAQFMFFAFSFGSGFAQTEDQLIICRTFQGIGGSGLYTIALIIWQEVSTLQTRKFIGGAIGMCIASGGVMGPILGGIITQNASWRWIFWINPPIMVLSTTLFIVAYPHGCGRLRPASFASVYKVDWLGTLLLIGGCVLPCFALMHAAEVPGSWNTGSFIGSMVGGLISWILLVVWGVYHTTKMPGRLDAAFPPHLFRNRRYAATTAGSLLIGLGYVACLFSIPLRVQTVHGKGPLIAGLTLLPLLCCSAVGSIMGSVLSPTKDRFGPTIMVGSAIMALGTGLLAILDDSAAIDPKIYGFQCLVGLGFGMTASASTLVANIESKMKDHAVAQGITAAARVFGGAVGLAASTTIRGDDVRIKLASISSAALQNLHLSYKNGDLTDEQILLVRKVYSDSYSKIFIMAAGIAAAGFLCSLFAWNGSTEPLGDRLLHKAELQEAWASEDAAAEKESEKSSEDVSDGSVLPSKV
ncbi:unnamed protein product [Zymoseptoria tritici ST99CH_1A5]|uniref:Major facilitator superfamily transporter n=4 Tax=Zymoseptoria tritici TaxID=1047171 RepID=F9XE47_ZYMTI|nr:putative major facilitator superfamily transporter [Zymoseptoria tritici IPO323]EGP86308.1 putative major facilitator superfamily transporter [Zymoseptoria tritici IPO323]SMR53424.1 unnamed protein product [Zymoseptoria tritici ST99CH_1E4]SMR55850.1 unnamed protein product [Zymoseptoria tritici ST99CH_3D1]SMY25036.1 unnamed protein product [Zymoseptoria tritici ST99CH_1A5]